MSVFAFASRKNLVPYIPLLAYGLFAGFIAIAGYQGFRKIEHMIEVEKLNDLEAIANLKVGQIASWRDMHRRRAESFSNSSLLAAEFERWLKEGKPSDRQEQKFLQVMANLQLHYAYESVSFLDQQGNVSITTGKAKALDGTTIKLAQAAMKSQRPIFSDIYRSDDGSRSVRIFLAAPLIDAADKMDHAVGVVLLQIDPRDFLFPLIQVWPSQSRSAETLLVRQEGEEVLFINKLRHHKASALSLRFPLATTTLPSVMAIHGETSTLNGADYRGIPVVAAMRRVPGTSWFLISKVDRSEIFASISQLQKWAGGLILASSLLGGFFFYTWLQGVHARQRQLKAEHDAALEREMRIRHFEFLTRYANDIILVADEKGRIIEANERAVETYGYTREELLHLRIPDIRPLNDDPAVFSGQIEQIMTLGNLRFEDINRRKDGTTFPVEVSANFIEVQGVTYVQGIIRDISEHKLLDEMRAKMEHIGRLKIAGEMASGMAHELSQPLTACSNYLAACLRRIDDETWDREKLRQSLKHASIQAERAGMIINHLKDMVRKQRHEHTLVDMNQLVRDVFSLLEDEIKRLGISVFMAVTPLPQVMAYRIEIEQVIFNLCKNAIEAMSSWPQRELRISTRVLESGHVLIAVCDTGMGILPAEQEKLFSPFQSSKKDGLGLGLVICRSIVENHGGQIWMDAKREFGAEFCFTLPIGARHE